MKLANRFATAGIVLTIGLAAPLARGQMTEPGMSNGSPAIAPAATSPTVPAEKAAPGPPGSAVSADKSDATMGSSQEDIYTEDYVAKKIADAQLQGKDVSTAKAQEAMGEAALKKGMNDEAAQHFETALRSIGVMPNSSSSNTGESGSPHRMMPGSSS
jgi:hypothetical protein